LCLTAANLTAGALAVPAAGFCDTTDAEGYYEIRNIYYYSQAELTIVPFKAGSVSNHVFSPASAKRSLEINSRTSSGVNFTDQSVFTVGGKVTYPASGELTACGIPGVEILVNGQRRGIFTDGSGNWDFTIHDEGSYTFRPVYLRHSFENAQHNQETTVQVSGDVTNIHFTDVQKDESRSGYREVRRSGSRFCHRPGYVARKLLQLNLSYRWKRA